MIIYTDLVREIVADVAARVDEFSHLDPERIGVLAAARCSGRRWGNLASCCGLTRARHPSFSIWTRPGSRTIIAVGEWFQYRSPRVRLDGREVSYLILLRLPRLLLRNPLPTLIHELYHIGEGFDGKMRPVRHGPGFDREVRRLTRNWLEVAKGKLPRLAEMRMDELKQEFGTVLAESVPNRFVFPLVERVEPPESYEQGVERLYPGYRLATSYEVRPTRVTGAGSPRHLSEKELVLRLYDRDGTQRVPAVFARYGRRHLTRGS